MAADDTIGKYREYSRRKVLFILASAVVLAVLSVYTITLGDTGLSFSEALHYLIFPDDSWESLVVWDYRFKMIVAAILAGAALAVAGTVMQSILRNPLASPFTLGLSNAAAFGAAFSILFMNGGVIGKVIDVTNPALVTISAFAFAMVATGIMLVLVRMTDSKPETIVLAGMAISSIFSAGLAFLQYMADDTQLATIVFWQFGSLSKISWNQLGIVGAALLVIGIYYFYKRWDYNALESGEDVARGLGINIRTTRVLGLVLAAVLTAVVVSFMGVIGFIGLVGPHIVKRIVGNDIRYVLPGSMLIGATVLLLAYVVGQYAFYTVIPVGIITSAIGGPLFIAILLRGYRK